MSDTGSKPRSPIFKSVPAAVKTLRASYKDKTKLLDPQTVQKEVDGDSDRSCVIFLAAALDDALTYRIASTLDFKPSESEFDHVFRFEGPLGTFSSRMEIACLFGVIDGLTYQQLDVIRELRNACAHSKHALSFSDTTFANVVRRLFKPIGFTDAPSGNDPKELKAAMIVETTCIQYTLSYGSREKALQEVIKMLKEGFARNASRETRI